MLIPHIERFMEKVDMSRPPLRVELGPCWEWTDNKDRFGYGRFKCDSRSYQAHKWIVEYIGQTTVRWEPDERRTVNHLCDNRACVKPSHLYVGDQKENVADAIAVGKHHSITWRGGTNHGIRLNAEQALYIRDSTEPASQVAIRFGISAAGVYAIRNRKIWKGLPG